MPANDSLRILARPKCVTNWTANSLFGAVSANVGVFVASGPEQPRRKWIRQFDAIAWYCMRIRYGWLGDRGTDVTSSPVGHDS